MEAYNLENAKEIEFSKIKEFDLIEYLQYLLLKRKLVVLLVILALAVSLLYSYVLATPVYEATAQLYVVNSKDSVINLSDLQIGSYLTSDYQLVFKTWEVSEQVIVNLGLPYSVVELQRMLTVNNPSNTRALFITVSSEDPKEAASIANEFASVAQKYISDTMLTDMPTTLSVALEPLKPVRPRKMLIIGVSTLLGVMIALWIVFIMYSRDDKIKSSIDIEKYSGSMPLAVIPLLDHENTYKRKYR